MPDRTTKNMGMTHSWRSLAGGGVSKAWAAKSRHAWREEIGDFREEECRCKEGNVDVIEYLRGISDVRRRTRQRTFEVDLSTMPLYESVNPARQRRNTWKMD